MTKRHDVYKCLSCKQVIKVGHPGVQSLVCCGQKMIHLEENTEDAATEKHVPMIEKIDGGFKVTVGEVKHPMFDEHLIEWIELIAGDEAYTKYLKAGDKPVAIFKTDATNVTARAYCNLHGNWKKES